MSEPTGLRVLLRGVQVSLDAIGQPPERLAARHLRLPVDALRSVEVLRRAVDARRGPPRFELQLLVELEPGSARLPAGALPAPQPEPLPPPARLAGRPQVAVVGCGPAGLFAAWRLCQAGAAPVLIERGPGFPARHQAIARLLQAGQLDPEANFHFGLGGAGTYSDGKLYTRLTRPAIRAVLEQLQRLGAGSRDQILVDAHPHVGTDRWPPVLERFLAELKQSGCTFQFATRVCGLRVQAGRLSGLRLESGTLPCQAVVLAPGNSARDLFAALAGQGVPLEAKAFAVGVRMTHPQALIDRIQYGHAAGHPALGPASYRLAGRFAGRGVYSFCMCPGGTVIPTPTEPEGLAVNGMSNSGRNSGEANAAVVVSVDLEDLPGSDPLAGMELQRRLERAAFAAGGGGYRAPAQGLVDFLAGRPTARVPDHRYRPGLTAANLASLFPDTLSAALRDGLSAFCRNMPGLSDSAALLIGIESRTSSPVRILRDADGMSPALPGLFPAGEGAGYAGGISSSAADGIRAADALIAWVNR